MFSLRRRRQGAESRVAIGIHPDGFALVSLAPPGSERPALEACEFVSWGEASERHVPLADALQRLGLRGSSCVCILPPESYSLRILEAPTVPPAELKEALRWQVAELIEFDVAEALIDTIPLPADAQTGPARLYVAIARRSHVREYVEMLEEAGLRVGSVEIPELALRNVVGSLAGGDAGTAVMHTLPKGVHLTLIHERHVYLSRDIAIDPFQAEETSGFEIPELGETVSGPADDLALELQRSLDYYEREFRKPPISWLRIAPSEREWSEIAPQLDRNLTVRVSLLDLSDLVDCPETVPQAVQAACFAPMGALLRRPEDPQIDLSEHRELAELNLLSPVWMVRAVAGLVVLLALVSGAVSWSNRSARRELTAIQARHAQASAQVDQLTGQLSVRNQDPGLAATVAMLSMERDAKARFYRSLSGEGLGNTLGLSGFLEGLARQTVPGLWLQQIQIKDGGAALTLVGSSLEPARVPQLLSQLADEEPFLGKEFRTLRIEESVAHPGAVDFRLSTRAEDDS